MATIKSVMSSNCKRDTCRAIAEDTAEATEAIDGDVVVVVDDESVVDGVNDANDEKDAAADADDVDDVVGVVDVDGAVVAVVMEDKNSGDNGCNTPNLFS